MQQQKTKHKTLYGLQLSIFTMCVVIFILFVIILSISVHQYMYYKITDGTLICSDKGKRCALYFTYINENTKKPENKIGMVGYNDIGESGVFSVKVAYHSNKNDTTITDYFIIGSKYHLFLGTTNMIIVYAILSFITLIICICMAPMLRYDINHKK